MADDVRDDVSSRRVSLAILPTKHNRIRAPLRVVACWHLGGRVFEFDHKFIGDRAAPAFAEFKRVRDRHPDCPIALFGHTDPSGSVDYNHGLSAERAMAVYGVLTGDVDIWTELYQDDADGLAHLKSRLRNSGYEVDPAEPGIDETTRAAIALHLARVGGGLGLEPYDFLGEHGQFSMQACSELNPVLRLSHELRERLSTNQRHALNAHNRRVLAFFFEAGTHVDGWWPCPRPGTGVQACRTRLWSDAEQRLRTPSRPKVFRPVGQPGSTNPPFTPADDTFACRFYDRIAHDSGCETTRPRPIVDEDEDEEEDEDDVVDPIPEPDPDPTFTLLATCEHPNHFNGRYLQRRGVDKIEVVPSTLGDLVSIRPDPPQTLTWTVAGKKQTGPVVNVEVPHIPLPHPKPWDLMRQKPVRTIVQGIKEGPPNVLFIDAYPDAQFLFDFTGLRDKLMEVWEPILRIWRIVGRLVADEFELDVLGANDFGGKLALEWREYPGRDRLVPDHRAYLAMFLAVEADPLVRVAAEMSISLGRLLKKLKKVLRQLGKPKRLEWLRRLLDALPESLIERLEAVKLTGTIAGSGGGSFKLLVDHPDRRIPRIGIEHDPEAKRAEVDGHYKWRGSAEADLEKLIGAEFPGNVLLRIEASFEMQLTLGFILDLEARRIGGYGLGQFSGLRVSVKAQGPGMDEPREATFEAEEPITIERTEFTVRL